MASNARIQRQSLACGFEPPPPPSVRVQAWDHPDREKRPGEDKEPPICPGYLCHLPEVIEIARAHLHWSKGSLHTFCRGEPVTERLNDGVEIFEGALNSLSSWLMKPKE